MCWDETIAQWRRQGLPDSHPECIRDRRVFWARSVSAVLVLDDRSNDRSGAASVEGIVSNMDDYLRLRHRFFRITTRRSNRCGPGRRRACGEAVVWITLEGATSGFRGR